MRIYTATRFLNYAAARRFNADTRAAGHEVVCDWTISEEFDDDGKPLTPDGKDMPREIQAKIAAEDLAGPRNSDITILLPVDDMAGAYLECGVAINSGKQVWIAGEHRFLIFWALPSVTVFPDENAIREALDMVQT